MFQTHWLSDAVKTVMAQVNNQSYFVRTGTLMTLDGSLDSQIKLEGWTKEYKFRDPADWAPVVVQPRIATADELKTKLRLLGLPTGGNKPELERRLAAAPVYSPVLHQYRQLKVAQLREAAEAKGLSAVGLKHDLLARLEHGLTTQSPIDPIVSAAAAAAAAYVRNGMFY